MRRIHKIGFRWAVFLLIVGLSSVILYKWGGLLQARGATNGMTTAIPHTPQSDCGVWNRTELGNHINLQEGSLVSLIPISANEVWSVGNISTSSGHEALMMHWDGINATADAIPTINSNAVYLTDITSVSTTNIWAIGYYDNPGGLETTLILHWDGTNWNTVTGPNPGRYHVLSSISAISSNDIWAVGYYANAIGESHTLIIHWNGMSWNLSEGLNNLDITSSDAAEHGGLADVATISSNDIWAVGTSSEGTLTMHWDGGKWRVVPSPNPGLGGNLTSVAAVSTRDIWAVGSTSVGTLVLHWDGATWTRIESPRPGAGSSLNSIAAISANNIWAVGDYRDRPGAQQHGLAIHWDGKQWSTISSPQVGIEQTLLQVSALSSQDVWIVGNTDDQLAGMEHPFMAKFSGEPCALP